MIARMSKYNFVLFAAQSEDFVEKLRGLGLVDITTAGWEPSEEDRQLLLDIESLAKAAEFLPRRGALRRCRRAVRFGRGGLCALRRRAPRGRDAQRRDRAAGKSGRGAASLGGVRRGGDAETRRPGHCPALFLHPAQHLRQAVGRVVGALYGFGGQPHRCHGVVRRRGQARRGGYARRAGDEDPDDGHSRGGAPHRRSRRETPDPRR